MKTIIFDFGNVIGFFDHQQTLDRVLLFTDMSAEEIYRSTYGGPLEFALEAGQISAEEFIREVRTLCRFRCDEAFLTEAFLDIFSPNPEVCELIPKLNGNYRLMLGSNTNALHAEQFQSQFADVLSHFEHLVLSHEIKTRKPHKEFFEHCKGLTGCAASECVFIDDMPANVAAARSVGLHALLYKPDGTLRQKLHDLGVRNVD